MHVLVVRGEGWLGDWLTTSFVEVGWTVEDCARTSDVPAAVAGRAPELVVADVAAATLVEPWVAAIRSVGSQLVVVSRNGDDEPEDVLGAGADSYIRVPVGQHELVARLRAVARRRRAPEPGEPNESLLVVGELALSRVGRRVLVGARTVPTTPIEFGILELLMTAAPASIGRSELTAALWEEEPGPGTLDAHVRRIRARLEAEEGWRRIETVRGVGFRLLTRPGPRTEGARGRPEPTPEPGFGPSQVPVRLDPVRRAALIGERSVPMPRREYEILEMLVAGAGQTVARSELVTTLWGPGDDVRTIDVHVRRLRARLESGGLPRCIHTVRGVGFRLSARIEAEAGGDRCSAFTGRPASGHEPFPLAREGSRA